MMILMIHPNPLLEKVFADFFHRIPIKTYFLAKTTRTGLDYLRSSLPIQLVLADHSLPDHEHILTALQQETRLRLIPYLKMYQSPDAPQPHPRINGWLKKPFGLGQLQQSLQLAAQDCRQTQKHFLVFTPRPLSFELKPQGHWQQIQLCHSPTELATACEQSCLWGGVLIDFSGWSAQELNHGYRILKALKRNYHPQPLPITGLLPSPSTHSLARLCSHWITQLSPLLWDQLLEQHALKLQTHWSKSILIQKFKTYFQRQAWAQSTKTAQQLIELDPYQPESYFQLGQSLEAQQCYPQAQQAYTQALQLNPSLLGPRRKRDLLLTQGIRL